MNVTAKCVHRPDPFEEKKHAADWKAKGCQWRYGLLSHKRSTVMPDGPLLCPGCFGFKRAGTKTKLVSVQPVTVPDPISSDSDSAESKADTEASEESN